MADNPNQIDISLSLLGADSPAVLTSLVQTLQSIEKTMGGVQSTMASYELPSVSGPLAVADGSGASRAPAATSVMDQRRLPSTAPDATPTTSEYYAQSESPDEAFFVKKVAARHRELAIRKKLPDVMEDKTEPERIFIGGAADSGQLPEATNLDDTASFFGAIQQRLATIKKEVSGFTSSFGEDAPAMLGVMGGLVRQGTAGVWNGIRGVTPGADTNPGLFAQAKNIGINLAGAPWVFQNMMKVLPTTLPMLADPGALTAMGGESGRSTVGSPVGPFSIPYLSGAGKFGVQQTVESFWEGLTTAGLTGKQALNIRQNLTNLGWAGQDSQGDLDRMTRTVENVIKTNKAFDVPTTAAMLDKSLRWGGHSLQEFQTTLLKMPDAARAAKMSLTEFQKAVGDVAGTATQFGADYMTGLTNTVNFSQMSGLPPQLYGQLMQNPWVQANLMGTTGALPFEQGLLPPGTTMMAGMNVANMLTDTFMNAHPNGLSIRDSSGRLQHVSRFKLATADAAHVLGMSPQELRKMENSRTLMPHRARAWDDLNAYVKDAKSGKGDQAWRSIQQEILEGHYKGGKGGTQYMRNQLSTIYNETKGDPKKRVKETEALLSRVMNNAPGTKKDGGVVISLAGDAARYFRLNSDKVRNARKINAGAAGTKNGAGMPGVPAQETFDPYSSGTTDSGQLVGNPNTGYWGG